MTVSAPAARPQHFDEAGRWPADYTLPVLALALNRLAASEVGVADPPDDGAEGDGGGGGGGKGPEWITVATFSLSTQAHLARLKLESEDIDCVIVDEHLITTNWLLSPAVGGIKLQVPRDQATVARQVLGGEAVVWDEAEAIEMSRCPKCGQGEFRPAPTPRWVLAVSVALLGIPLLFLPKRWVCDRCGAVMGES